MAEEVKERGLTVYKSRDGQEIRLSFDTVKKYLVSGKPELVTDQEMMLYIGMCKARGLNPFKRDCYLIKYTPNDSAATVVSIDYFRSRAKAQEDCVGWKAGIIVRNDEGLLNYREGSFISDDEELLGGWFKAKPTGWTEPIEWSVSLKPFIKTTREGNATQFWQPEKQPYMIAKVAESQGLRRVWPDEFQGLYEEDEIQPRDVTPAPEHLKTPKPPRVEKADDNKEYPRNQSGDAGDAKQDGRSAASVDGAGEAGKKAAPVKQGTRVDDSTEGAGQPSPENIAILAIDSYQKESWPDAEVLTSLIKDLDQPGKVRVCRYFDMRKREVLGA